MYIKSFKLLILKNKLTLLSIFVTMFLGFVLINFNKVHEFSDDIKMNRYYYIQDNYKIKDESTIDERIEEEIKNGNTRKEVIENYLASMKKNELNIFNIYVDKDSDTLGNRILVITMAFVAIIIGFVFTSIEEMSRYRLFLYTLPVKGIHMYLAKFMLGSLIIFVQGVIYSISQYLLYRNVWYAEAVDFRNIFSSFLGVLFISISLFCMVMFIGSFVGNILSQVAVFLFLGSGFVGMFMMAIGLSYIFNIGYAFMNILGDLLERKLNIVATPLSVFFGRIKPHDVFVFFVIAIVMAILGAVLLKYKEYSRRCMFFSNRYANNIFLILATIVFDIAISMVCGGFLTGRNAGVMVIFLLLLYPLYKMFKLLFACKLGF